MRTGNEKEMRTGKIMVKGRNSRKAQFFSLTVFLLILFLVFLFSMMSKAMGNEEQFNIDRLGVTIMNNYVSDFENIYVDQIIRTSLKPAVAAALENGERATKERIATIMDDGGGVMDTGLSMQSTLRGVLGTVTYSLDNDETVFDVTLDSIEQLSPTQLQFTFSVDYRFQMGDTVWSRTARQVVVDMDIHSLYHPAYEYAYIDEDWEVDNNATACFADQAFADADTCSAAYNLKPAYQIETEPEPAP